MKKNLFMILFSLLTLSQFPLTLTTDQMISLFLQNTPESLKKICDGDSAPMCQYDNIERIRYDLENRDDDADFQYLTFTMPNEPYEYLLLCWRAGGDLGWWRLLKTNDGGENFSIVCETPKPLIRGINWKLWLSDLTGDSVPELIEESSLIGSSAPFGMNMHVWQWKNNCFQYIVVNGEDDTDEFIEGGIGATSLLEIDDLDGDGKAEIIKGPYLTSVSDEDPTVYVAPCDDNWHWKAISGTSFVYHYDGSKFVKWYELDPNEPYAIYVPSLGAFHPSTLPLSELSNPGDGKIKIFVSDPAGALTADNFVTNSFEYNGNPLSFKKIWKNNKQPDESSANFEFAGTPVKQTIRNSQGEWQTNPSDPFILSPDQKMEYHFCGKYVELETTRALVFPNLKEKAEKYFDENPGKEQFFETIPIRAKFTNNKIGQVSAFVCIKKTGNQELKGDDKQKMVNEQKKIEPKQSEKK